MSELAQKQVTPDTSKVRYKTNLYILFQIFYDLKWKISILFLSDQRKIRTNKYIGIKKVGKNTEILFSNSELGVVSGVTCFYG